MKSIKLSIVAALLATTSVVSSVSASEVEVSANMALTSNYVWRGMTQSGESPAVQGGVDLGYGGFYAGVWGSSVEFSSSGAVGGITKQSSSEFDVYGGYAGEFSGVSYDVGFIQYMYPNDTTAYNFSEAYLSLGYDFGVASVSAMYAMGVDADVANTDNFGDVMEIGVSVPLPMDIALDGTYGNYDDKNTVNIGNPNTWGDYYSVSLTKTFGKFDITLAQTGMDYDQPAKTDVDYTVVTLATSF